jgi:hypothetical protein
MNSHFHAQDAMRRLIQAAIGVAQTHPTESMKIEMSDSARRQIGSSEREADRQAGSAAGSKSPKLI